MELKARVSTHVPCLISCFQRLKLLIVKMCKASVRDKDMVKQFPGSVRNSLKNTATGGNYSNVFMKLLVVLLPLFCFISTKCLPDYLTCQKL
jgi:hypothetical protein